MEKKRKLTGLHWLGISLLAILIVLLALPTILSTRWGNDLVLSIANKQIPGTIHAEDIHLSWFGDQSANKILLTDKEGQPVFTAKSLSTEMMLWSLLWGSDHYGRTEVVEPHLKIEVDSQGKSTLEKAIGRASSPFELTTQVAGPPRLKIRPHFPLPFGTLSVQEGQVSVAGPGYAPVQITDINGQVVRSKKSNQVRVQGSGKSLQRGSEGSFSIDLVIDQFAADGAPFLAKGKDGMPILAPGVSLDSSLSIQNFPVAAIDQLATLRNPEWTGFLTQLLGERLSATGSAKGRGEDAAGSLTVASTHLSGDIRFLLDEGHLTLSQPGKATLVITPEASRYLLGLISKDKELKFAEPIELSMQIDELKASLDIKPLAITDLSHNSAAQLPKLHLSHPQLGELMLNTIEARISSAGINTPLSGKLTTNIQFQDKEAPFTADITVSNYVSKKGKLQLKKADVDFSVSTEAFPVAWFEELLEEEGQLATLLGPSLAINAKMSRNEGRGKATIEAKSERLDVPKIELTTNSQVELAEPVTITYQLTPGAWKLLMGEEFNVQIANPTELQLQISKLNLPWSDKFSPKKAQIEASIKVGKTPITGFPMQGDATLNWAVFRIGGKSLAKGRWEMQSLWSFPEGSGPLARFLGEGAPVDMVGDFSVSPEGDLSFPRIHTHLHSRQLIAQTILAYDPEKGIVLLLPIEFEYEVSPQDIPRLHGIEAEGVSLLADSFRVKGTLTPLKTALPIASLDNLQLSGSAETSPINFSGEPGVEIEKLHLSFEVNFPKNAHHLKFNGETRRSDGLPGKFSGNFRASDIRKWKGMDIEGDVHMEGTPTDVLVLMSGSHTLHALFGHRVSGNISFQLKDATGPLSLHLYSNHSRANLEGQLDSGVLHLRAPLTAALHVTPELGDVVLADFNPLFVTALRSENPITFRIEAEGFELPLFPLELGKFQMKQGTLDLGQLWVQNAGFMDKLLRLFKRPQLSDQGELLTWSTPLYFSIKDGLMTYNRMDTMIGTRLQIALWGTLNLVKKEANFRMAIPGHSLRSVLGVPGISDSYYLIFPLRGTLPNLDVDWNTMTARIAALLARKEGAAGQVLGGLVDIAAGTRVSQKKVPPPTTQPFPWSGVPEYSK